MKFRIVITAVGAFLMLFVMVAGGGAASAQTPVAEQVVGPVTAQPDAAVADSGLIHCGGNACTGLLPEETFCYGDAIFLEQRTYKGATIQLRYSPSCRAVWARELNGTVGDFLWVRNSDDQQEETHIHSGTDNHTAMVNDKDITASACMTRVGETHFTCTPWA